MANLNVGIREAKASLSKLLRMVAKGNEVVLTDHGRPVGKLVPIDSKALPLASRIREMEESGIIDPPVWQRPLASASGDPGRKGDRCRGFSIKTGVTIDENRWRRNRRLLGHIGGALIAFLRQPQRPGVGLGKS